jgi:Cu+-exporting ATPase
LGNLIEKRTIKQTTTSIENLSRLKPDKANLVVDVNGFEMTDNVPAAQVKVGDMVRVNMGDRIPLDGKIISGSGFADESMLTGESIPVEKQTGDFVSSGTMLQQGSIKVSVTATAGNSYLSKLIELVKTAHAQKPDVQRFADKVSNVFVPVVLAIAIFTFLMAHYLFGVSFTQSLLNSVAVLAIACPCAMGLATPTAIMVGLGRVAGKGILIKGAKTVEQLSGIKNVVFDKTGTLTTGEFKIEQIKLYADVNEEEVKALIKGLEQHSSHPIASSIMHELQNVAAFQFKQVEEVKGKGIKGIDDAGNVYWLGSYRLLQQVDKGFDIYLLKNDELIAALDIMDEIKPEAKAVIVFLKSEGIKVTMLSGDNPRKCEAVARKLNIKHVYSSITPEEKLNIISKLSKIEPTAMVGDGINDAPALAKATIGISLSDASAAAIDSAQVILLKGNLLALKEAILISRHTFSTIKQNLFWALSYNLIAIPIAASGFLSPMVAALSMAFSDVVVIGNSLLLKWKNID